MADEATTTAAETQTETTTSTESTEDQRVPYERFQQANKKAKEAADRAKALETQMTELQQQVEERESAGLPELEQLRKRLETAEKRAEQAESAKDEAERAATLTKRERLVTTVASKLNFIDPDDATRYVDLDEIEDADQAERAVKRVAKAKPHLVRDEEPKIPGQVLKDGRAATPDKQGGINLSEEAQMVSDELKKFLANRR